MERPVKLILGILFLLCLADMPFGYYQFVRFPAMIGFALLAWIAQENGNQTEAVIWGAFAILFQQLFKIALGRSIWNIVDVVVAVGLFWSSVRSVDDRRVS